MEFILQHKKRTAIPLIWLLIYLSIIPMQLSNYVLCIGTDGHVEFEVAVNGRCADTHGLDEGRTEVMTTTVTAGEHHCGSCLDLAIFVPLDSEPYLVPIQDALIHPPDFVATLITHRINGSTLLTHTPLLDTPSVIAPTLISLRTTTLLI